MAKRSSRPARASTRTSQDSAPTSVAAPELDAEFANRARDPFETDFMGVIRTNDPLLLERGQGNPLFYRDLKRDGKVFDGLQKRTLALVGKPYQVEPVQRDDAAAKQDAETVTALLKACNFDKLCSELLEALLTGYAVAEIVWTYRDNMIVPERLVKRAQRRFVYVQTDDQKPPELHLLTKSNMITGEPVPERKFIVHRVNPEDDNPYGTGLGLQLYWPVFFKRKGLVAWNKLCDRFGSPTIHGKYPNGASQKEKGTLADALRAFTSSGYVMTPTGMEVALIESKLTGNVTTQQALCEYMDAWIAAVLTGQEAPSTGGGALAAASKERQDVRQDLTQADSDLLSETINGSLVKWLCEYNGLAPCLVYRQIKEEDDLKAQAEGDAAVASMGFELDEATIQAKYGEGWHKKAPAMPPAPFPAPTPAPSPGEAPAGPPVAAPGAPSPAPAGAPGAAPAPKPGPANFAELSPTDALDQLVTDALGDWQPLMSPFVQRLQALLDDAAAKGETAQQLLDRLPQLLQELDADPLQGALTQTAFAARLAANAGIQNT